jgi:hypothetical protein
VLIGLTAPAALTVTFQRQLKPAYTVALQRQFDADGELAAYQQVRRWFTAAPANPVLTGIVTYIHDTSPPPSSDHGATSTEQDLARRLGELQATWFDAAAAQSLVASERAAASRTGFDAPAHSPADLDDRVGAVEAQENEDNASAKRAEQAGDLAAAAVASTISIPHISDNEVVQIVREYLSGLIEDSPLKDVFAAWVNRLPGRTPPPEADVLVIPDPDLLEQSASDALSEEFSREGLADPITDPNVVDPAYNRTLTESSVAAAVDLMNQVRYLQEHSGPCAGCASTENPGDDEPAEPAGEEHEEP